MRHTKTFALAALLLLAAFSVTALLAEDSIYRLNKEPFSQTLRALLDAARDDLGITINVTPGAEKYLDQTVPMAPWKYWSDPQLRLAYILAPLDLSFEKKGENEYLVFEPIYHIRPESEAANHLKRLLARYPDLASWEARREEVKASMLRKLRLDPMPIRCTSDPILGEERIHDGYSVRNIALEVIPHYWLCGSLYRPLEQHTPFPVLAVPHGHGQNGRFDENQQIRAATLARMGATALAYSMFAWIEGETPLKHTDHQNPISGTMQTLATMRVVDYLLSLEGADPTRVGITGESGGGTQTFYATALDDRITLAVPVVMVSAHFFGGCPCESGNPVHIETRTCNAEIAALAAPRPLKLVAVTQDWTKNTPEVEYPYIRTIFGYYGAEENVEYEIFDEKHDYGPSKRQAMYPFVAKHFGMDAEKIDESKVTIETKETLFPFGPELENYPADGVRSLEELLEAFEQCPKQQAAPAEQETPAEQDAQ
ncbi:MAG: acetylxylan esterase [Thermoguttaceae bacterium]|nr:acetylxylan esterase [Thermoguttaceae bacterium]